MLMHGEGPVGEERLWKGVIEPAMIARSIRALYQTPAVSLVKYRGEIIGVIAERGGRRFAVWRLRKQSGYDPQLPLWALALLPS